MTEKKAIGQIAQPRLRKAFEHVKPELAKLRRAELVVLNVDPIAAAATMRTALPRLNALRPSLEKSLSDFDFSNLDKLETYALALIHAHSLFVCAKLPPERLAALATECTTLRAQLLVDVSALAKRGFVKGVRPNALGRSTSYRKLASDILTLAGLISDDWAVIASHCGVTKEELARAEVLADELIQAVGQRDRAPDLIAEATLDRQKVYTLCVRAYDQMRRAVTYLRWERGDEDEIAPPLSGKRRRGSKKGNSAAKMSASSEAAASAVGEPSATAAAEPAVQKVASGLPGADPFLH
jgi:hypothetical protein